LGYFIHPSCNQVQSISAKENIALIEADVTVSNSELIIETKPEVVVIMGYAQFGNNLEIYGN
jgi:hypothetical protein